MHIKKLTVHDLPLVKQLLYWFQADDEIEHPIVPTDDYLLNLLSKDSFHILVAIADDATLIGGLTAFEIPTYYN